MLHELLKDVEPLGENIEQCLQQLSPDAAEANDVDFFLLFASARFSIEFLLLQGDGLHKKQSKKKEYSCVVVSLPSVYLVLLFMALRI